MEQYSVHLLTMSFSPVHNFPALSCMLQCFACLFCVRYLTIWNAPLLLFLLMSSSVSLHCYLIQFSVALLTPLFIALLISLYFAAHSVVLLSFFIHLRLSHMSSKSPVTQGFFFWRYFPRILLTVSVTAVLELLVIVSTFSSTKQSEANFPPIVALNSSATLGLGTFPDRTLFWCSSIS